MGTKTDELLQQLLDAQGPLGYARLAQHHESAITASAVAGLVARPTTTALVTIFNGEALGGKSLVIDRLFCFQFVSGGAQAMFQLWYCNHTQLINVAKPANDITTLRGTGDGREPDLGTVRVNVGATVLDDGWFPVGGWGEAEEAGVLPGGGTEWECDGRLIVQPKAALSLHVSAGTINEDFTVGASWWRMHV
jgi:hypothetical protein